MAETWLTGDIQVVENVPDLSRISPEEVKKYVDNQIRRQTRIITLLIRLVDRLMIFFYVSIIYRSNRLVSRHTHSLLTFLC